jgi:hypothetical protein
MSEDEQNQENQKKESRIKIELDRSKELENLYQENKQLERANAELEQKAGEPDYQKILEEQAVQKFREECERLGLDPAQTSPEALKTLRDLKKIEDTVSPKAPRGGETAPLEGNYYDILGRGNQPLSEETQDLVNIHSDSVPCELLKWSSEKAMIEGLKKIRANSDDSRQKEAARALSMGLL